MTQTKFPWTVLLSLLTSFSFLCAETCVETSDCDEEQDNCSCCCNEWQTDCEYAREHNLIGVWLPSDCPMFRPFIADPHAVTHSAGWRFNDNVLGKNIIDVSYGDILPFYKWCNIWWGGDLELDLECSLWAVFDPLHESSPLIDADYFVGAALVYGWGDWAIRFRGYHISTHIGDEFLLNNPNFDRRNPSIEVLDLYASWYMSNDIRLYAGVGWNACQDDSFRVSPWYVQGGAELRLHELGYTCYGNRLYGLPFFAMDFRYQSDYKRHVNATYTLGYEWGKTHCECRRFRIFLEYHDGYCVEGQFAKFPTNYLSIRVSYGF